MVVTKTKSEVEMIAMIEGFLWAWVAIGILASIGIICVIKAEINGLRGVDVDWWALVCFLGIIGLLQFATPVDPKSWVLNNGVSLIIYLIIYFALGFGWSLFKWFRFVRKQYKKYLEDAARWANSGKRHSTPNDYLPPPSTNRHRIIRWILSWPISMFWAVTCDFLTWIGGKIYNLGGEVYKIIADSVFSSLIEEEKKREANLDRSDD